jgi:hypothetical protein
VTTLGSLNADFGVGGGTKTFNPAAVPVMWTQMVKHFP